MTRFSQQLHERLAVEVGAEDIITLRTNVSVPALSRIALLYPQRQRRCVVDADAELIGQSASLRHRACIRSARSGTAGVHGMSVSGSIRMLARNGLTTAESARRLGIRYQHA